MEKIGFLWKLLTIVALLSLSLIVCDKYSSWVQLNTPDIDVVFSNGSLNIFSLKNKSFIIYPELVKSIEDPRLLEYAQNPLPCNRSRYFTNDIKELPQAMKHLILHSLEDFLLQS